MPKKRMILGFLILQLLLFSCVSGSPAYENFTTYTEYDPNSHITVSANEIDVVSYRDQDMYVYKDFGVDEFSGDFTHEVEFKIDSSSAISAYCTIWLLSNDIDDIGGLISASKTFLFLEIWNNVEGYNLFLRKYASGVLDVEDSTGYVLMYARYYLRIKRASTGVACEMFTDANRTSLYDNLTLTMSSSDNYRYIFPYCSRNAGGAPTVTVNIDKLELIPPAPPPPSHYYPLKVGMGLIGLFLIVISPTVTAYKVIKRKDYNFIVSGLVIMAIGYGLVCCWFA